MKYHLETTETVLESLGSGKNGLDASEARERLNKYGKNKLDEERKKSVFTRFVEQLADPMVIVLFAAAVISGALGEIIDSAVILFVVILNSILGVVQEGKAEKAIEALQKMTSPYSKVRRNGHVVKIKSEEIVPGDIVIIEAGDAIPADIRLLEASSLKVEEASLTGESVPVEKTSMVISADKDEEIPLGDRSNMVYMGTSAVYGRGEGVVTATGMSTEMGKIAGIISDTENEKTPLQEKLTSLGKTLSIAVLGVCILIFAFSIVRKGDYSGASILDSFMLAVSLAVAAVPEGLVAVVTVVLSIGVTKMSDRNAIIRRLTAVETLGCTQIICSDKTGTLTQNVMTVVDTFGNSELLAISMALCNDAALSDEDGSIVGEPTESALAKFALNAGKNKNELDEKMPRVAEAPFDSIRKLMTTIHKGEGEYIQYTKGAPDEILKRCARIITDEGEVPLTDELKNKVLVKNKEMADKALRVLGSALRHWDAVPPDTSPENLEKELTFIGLAGMIDPVRPEVKAAIKECRGAGIRPIMITGDHRDTAVAIAKELGIISDGNQAINGAEMAKMPDDEFEANVEKYSVYARVQPEHKVRIVNAWKKRGKITAMTGDGVNDAPALKSADIGVGMGITGTDVSKNVSDMVLADDNFATIVYAVEEGRRIYDNIKKSIQFLLSSNLSEVIALFLATIWNFKLFSPIHILLINLVTDSFPAISLGMEKAEKDIMDRPPRSAEEGIFSNGMGARIIYQGTVIAILTIISYMTGNARSHAEGMTMAFLTLSMCEIFHSLNLRSSTKSIFSLGTHNKSLLFAMTFSFLVTMAVVYVPGLNVIFELEVLPWDKLLTALGIAAVIFPLVELEKFISRSISKQDNIRESEV